MEQGDFALQADALKRRAADCVTNCAKRHLYSDSELLIIRLERALQRNKEDAELMQIKDELVHLSSTLALGYVQRPHSGLMRLLHKIDEILRLIGVWLTLTLASIFVALPCILLSPLDYVLVNCGVMSVYAQISVTCKLFLSRTMLRLSGIHAVVEGLNVNTFGKECVLACFSHSSSMDAFLITSAIPVTALTVCKAELFLIPYFSWCASAFGGVPINRENRDQAVKAMEAAAISARLGECMAISPEGTRSLTGQLLEFKKGPFYLWEQLQTPIIPIVTMGAFELFPPGSQMSLPGKVYVRFLDPIYPSEASSKEEMSALVRTRMLEAMKNVPDDVAAELTWRQRLVCWLNLAIVYYITWNVYKYIQHCDVLRMWHMTHMQAVAVVASASVLTTLLFYAYAVYIAPILRNLLANRVLLRKSMSPV